MIWGNQGGGKSWLARFIVNLKILAGYRVIVLDPDSNRREWRGLESYHKPEDIERIMRWYLRELNSRYDAFSNSEYLEEEWRSLLWNERKAITLVIEEATTYSSFIKDKEFLENFGKLALTKSRKQEMPILIISHNNTQSCLFGISGLYNLVSKMLQIECLAEVNPITLKPTASGKAKIKLDSSNDWIEVNLPQLDAKITDFTNNSNNEIPNRGDRIQETPSEHSPEPPQNSDEPLYQISDLLGIQEPLKTILDYAIKQQDWVSVRDIQRKDFAVFKGQGATAIRECFFTLFQKGYGQIDCQGNSVRFRVHQPESSDNLPDTGEFEPPDT